MAHSTWAALSVVGMSVVFLTGGIGFEPLALVAGLFFLLRFLLAASQVGRHAGFRWLAKAFALASLVCPVVVLLLGVFYLRSLPAGLLAVPFAMDAAAAWWAYRSMRQADRLDGLTKHPGG